MYLNQLLQNLKGSFAMSKKMWFTTVAVALLLASVVMHIASFKNRHEDGTSGMLEPSMIIDDVALRSARNKVSIDTRLVVKNPLPIDIHTTQIKYILSVNDTPIVQNAFAADIKLKARDTSSIKIPIELFITEVKEVVKSGTKRKTGTARYTIDTVVEVEIPVTGRIEMQARKTIRRPAEKLRS
jgi:LEA14-like dessication related protein